MRTLGGTGANAGGACLALGRRGVADDRDVDVAAQADALVRSLANAANEHQQDRLLDVLMAEDAGRK